MGHKYIHIRIRWKFETRIYSYSYSFNNLIFIQHWSGRGIGWEGGGEEEGEVVGIRASSGKRGGQL